MTTQDRDSCGIYLVGSDLHRCHQASKRRVTDQAASSSMCDTKAQNSVTCKHVHGRMPPSIIYMTSMRKVRRPGHAAR